MKHLTVLTLIAAVPFITGCGPARPKDMPETAPCKITVLQQGNPIPDVIVTLYREGGNGALNISGTTNAAGIAEIKTSWGNYTTKGAPVGTCKVTVEKYFEIPPETVTAEESALWTPEQGARYERERYAMVEKLRIFPVVISNIALTPLSVSVASRTGGTLTVEVANYKK